MGQELSTAEFDGQAEDQFRARLRAETKTLKRWFDERRFDHAEGYTTGLELEGWLMDENHLPAPRNEDFIAAMNNDLVVPELSQFNFELNAEPADLGGSFLSDTHRALDDLWRQCRETGEKINVHPLAIGILPTVRDEMLQPHWMSGSNRYKALNERLFHLRQNQPLHINISGEDYLDYRCPHLMLEAACTSLQAHLKINQEDAVRFYNASVLASGPLVAISANSPFLYGKSLWAETRIPAFEQATAVHSFRDRAGRSVKRVTLGTSYLRKSFLELFLENLSYPVLLPAQDLDGDETQHLRLQNGTIWRWNRPIIGFGDDGTPHLRIEQRVMPAGPTIIDMMANLALFYGLILAFAKAETPPESQTNFAAARDNFYACARDGLKATLRWNGNNVGVHSLLSRSLLPQARQALQKVGVDEADLALYFDDVLCQRLQSGQTGAQWQRAFIQSHGTNFQKMTEVYGENQTSGAPVHQWQL